MKTLIAVTVGLGLLLAACSFPPPKPIQTPVASQTPTPNTGLKITQPIEGGKVDQTEMVKGTSQRIPDGHVIWVVLFVQKVGRYYPQNQPADIQANGDWASVTYIGVPKDVGLKFDILAVSADKEGQNALNRYLVNARDRSDYAGLERLPNGVAIYDRVSVTRKQS